MRLENEAFHNYSESQKEEMDNKQWSNFWRPILVGVL